MRTFFTSVIVHKNEFTSEFQTEPYEVAWASEAICFICVESVTGRDAALEVSTQISADGIHWIDEGSRFEPITGESDTFLKLSHFGGWLRFKGRMTGSRPGFTLTMRLALKE